MAFKPQMEVDWFISHRRSWPFMNPWRILSRNEAETLASLWEEDCGVPGEVWWLIQRLLWKLSPRCLCLKQGGRIILDGWLDFEEIMQVESSGLFNTQDWKCEFRGKLLSLFTWKLSCHVFRKYYSGTVRASHPKNLWGSVWRCWQLTLD